MARRGFDRRNPPEPTLSGLDPAQHVQRIVEAAEQAAVQIREEAEAEAQRYLEEYKRRVDRLVSERVQLTDTLAEQTGRIKEQYDRFLAALDGALQKVGEIAGNGSELDPHESARRYAAANAESRLGPDPLAPPERGADMSGATRDEPARTEQPTPLRSRWRPKARAQAEPTQAEPTPAEPTPAEPAEAEPAQPERGVAPQTTPGGYRPRPAAKGERLLAMQMLAAGESRAEIERRLQDEFGMPDPGSLIDELLGE